jgi:RNA recognition motif-containing protein
MENNKLFVGGLPYTTTEETLKAHFEQIGTVVSVKIIIDKETGNSKGFGFVEMSSPEAVTEAIEKLNDTEVDGRKIRVSEARPQEKREFRPRTSNFSRGNRY